MVERSQSKVTIHLSPGNFVRNTNDFIIISEARERERQREEQEKERQRERERKIERKRQEQERKRKREQSPKSKEHQLPSTQESAKIGNSEKSKAAAFLKDFNEISTSIGPSKYFILIMPLN